MQSKIINIKEISSEDGAVLTYGHFSTIHPGHLRYLKHAKEQGTKLIIALIGDNGTNKFTFNQSERAEALVMLGMAEIIIMLDSDELTEVIRKARPKMLVLGNEYKNNESISEALEMQRSIGGKVQFHAGDVHYATSDLLSRSEKDLKIQRKKLFNEACKRQGIKKATLKSNISEWNKAKLIVLGDTIVDQYAACEAIGMSAEAPVVVVRELKRKNFIGGAAVVAAHIKALGASCDLVSVIGDDETAKLVVEELGQQNIGNSLVVDQSRPTTFKKRYVVENQKLFRVSRLEEHNLDSNVENEVIRNLEKLAPKAQGIVVSDFVYGVVTLKVLEKVRELASKYNLMLFGDVQCSSQIGAITKLDKFSLLCPNEREARLAMQDKDSGLEQLSRKLLEKTNTNRLIMKLGPEGFIVYDGNDGLEFNSQAFPALSVNPLDVAGAGDSLLAVFATGLSSGQQMMSTAALACCMSALAVENMGNSPISAKVLMNSLDEAM